MSALFTRRAALCWLGIRFDRSLDVTDAHRLLLSLISSSSQGLLVFETVWSNRTVSYRVGSTRPGQVKRLVDTFLPGVTVTEVERALPATGRAWAMRSSTRRRSLEVSDPEAVTHRLLGALAIDGAVYQVVVGRRLRPNAVPSKLEGFHSETWSGAALEAAWFGTRRIDTETRRAMAAKQGEPGADVNVRLLIPGDHARSVGVAGFASAVRSLEAPSLHLGTVPERWGRARAASASGKRMPLNASELTAVLGWPFGDRTYRGLDRSGSRVLPVASGAVGRIVGRGVHPASQVEVGLSAIDALRHLWVFGPTGVGKSTLLEHLALQDIEAGRGVVVIDPKGDLVDGLLARISAAHLDRIVLLDPARSDHIVGFNPLVDRSTPFRSSSAELAADGVLHVLRSLNSDSWGPRTSDIIHSCLLTLARSSYPTLVAIPQLLTDERFRRSLTGSQLSPALRSFWIWYDAMGSAEQASVIAPVMNKIRPFTMRSSLRAMLGQTKPAFDPNTIFTERKVLLVPLRKGQIGSESANLLGSLLMARLWQLAQGRTAISPERRHPVFAYLDEFQDYLRLPTDFTDVLAQSRGLGLGLVLAHQHLAQLKPEVRAAVSANAQSKIMFRLGVEDANVIARSADGLDAVDFSSLRAYSAYANLLTGGQQSGWGSIRTLPPRQEQRRHEPLATKLSKRWGVEPAQVDAALYGSSTDVSLDEPIGTRKRGPS